MKRILPLSLFVWFAFTGCLTRNAPSEKENEWEQTLRKNLPAGWKVVVVTAVPEQNSFHCWFEAPGPCRVEVKVAPREGAPSKREWTVGVHPMPDFHSRPASV